MTVAASRPALVAEPSGGSGASGRWGFAHVPALDGLRGAAVAAVLLYHLGHLEGGYLGVDLFFVLSGFLITSLLLSEHAARSGIELGSFWVRRARRLLPALLLLLVGVAAYAQFLARPVDLATIRADGLATLFYVANWHTIWQGVSYWDISLAPSPLQHAWSLAIEEQFYVVWPLVVVALARRTRSRGGVESGVADQPEFDPHALDRLILAVAGWGALASAVWLVTLHLLGASDTRLYQGTDTRAAALLGGAALAAWTRLHPRPTPDGSSGGAVLARTRAVGAGAAVALAAMWIWLPGTSPWLYRGGLALASLLAVVLIGAVTRTTGGPLHAVLAVTPLRALGTISYGLYLWHWPIYQVVDQRNGRFPLLGDATFDGLALIAVKVGLSVAAAVVSYVLVEQPIRRGALEGRTALMAALAAMAAAAAVIVASTTGAVEGQDRSVGDARSTVAGAPSVLFVGDSVAQSIIAPVVDDPGAFGINPINRTYPGCSPVAQGRSARNFAGQPIEPQACFRNLDIELSGLAPDAIFLLIGSRPNDEVRVDGQWVGACDPAFDAAYRDAVADLAMRLRTSGAPVVIGTISRTSENVVVRIEASEERIACANEQLGRVVDEVPGVTLVDLNEFVCPGTGACREELDGDLVRPDGLHFGDGPAGTAVAQWTVAQVLDRAGSGVGVGD